MIKPLTPLQLEVLAFERATFSDPGRKAATIRTWFGFSDTRYYQVLVVALDQPAAEVYDPELVRRLRRIRTTKQTAHRPAAARLIRGVQ